MMTTRSLSILIATTVLAASSAMAQTATTVPAEKDPLATPRIDKRQANQQKRIEAGVASGQVTAKEQDKLEKREAHIATAEEKAKADGTVSAKEKARLHEMEKKASKAIKDQKHDKQKVQPVAPAAK